MPKETVAGGTAHKLPADLQKALLAAWRNIPSFRGEAGFRTWLTRITWNFGAMVLRHRKSLRLADDPPKPLDVFPDTSSIFNAPLNPEQSAIVADFSSSVRTLVVNLPHNRRDPLYMWIFEEKNVGEIARELDLPMPTVKSRLRRARQELGGRLRAMGHGGECRSEVR